MGHGDEIVLADAHFPAHALHDRTLRADGISVTDLLLGILPLFPLDTYAPPVAVMQVVSGDAADPSVEREYREAIARHEPKVRDFERVERMAFYDRARRAYAIVLTGERRKYGNIILKKGLVL